MNNICDIAQLGADVLRQIAEPITDIHAPATQAIIAKLQATLASTAGVGLAAPQISIAKRVVIVASRPTPRYPNAPLMEATVMINPYFEILSDEQEKDWEGCLSIASRRALVPRYQNILIHYADQRGDLITSALHGFVARVFQHEVDHLDGKVYLDRVEDIQDIVSESEYLQRLQLA